MKFVSDLRQAGGFLLVLRFPPPINAGGSLWLLRFPPPIKLTTTI